MIYFKWLLSGCLLIVFGHAQFALPPFQAVAVKDNVGPRITITATDGSNAVASGSTTNDGTLSLTFTANEVASGFIYSDVLVVGGSISSFSGSNRTYTATFTPSGNRSTAISIPAGRFTDTKTNASFGSIPFYWTYDSSVPYMISGATMASDNSTVNVKFNEPTYNSNAGSGALETNDFTFSITGGSATLASSTPTSISKATPSFTTTVLASIDGPVSVTAYDLDLDNDMDIIVPLNPGAKLLWYENNGSQSFTERTIDASVSNPREAWPVDLDLDGDIDLVVPLEGGEELAWYENNGSQSFTKRAIDSGNNGRAVAVADIDADNDLDITFATYSSTTFSWYENDGSQNFTKNSINSSNVRDPVIIDLDEDGDLDFVSEIDDGSDKIVWYENDGFQSFTQNTIDNIDGGHLDVVDLDEDGDYDLVFAEYYNHLLLWYENDGSENFTKRTIDDSGVTNIWDVEVGDIDGDGDIDIVALTSTNNSTADDKIIWYANNGSESFTEYDVDTDLNHPYRLKLKDIDGDGDLDIVAGSRGGDQVIWYENVDGGYTLGVSLSGSATGAEVLTVSPASNAIYDVAGNAANTSQAYNTAYLNDKTGPTMTITAADGMVIINDGSTTNNSTLSLTFTSSETTSNFAIGDITVSGGSVSSFSGSGTTYYATFTPSASGATTIDVAGSTFTDAAGNNNSAASQFNWTYDGTLPTITGVSLASDNSTIAVTFSEAVYNTAGGSGSLETSDFVFSISGGSATLSSSTPSSISASSNTYTLGISLSGTANGSETLTVNPANSAIFDVVGNIASSSQSNNTANLNGGNYVLDLNGSNESAYYADNSNFEPANWSIQAWIDPSAVPSNSNNDFFIHKNKTYRIGLEYTASGVEVMGSLRYSGSYYDVNSGDQNFYVTTGGGWYHVVLTFDDSSNRLRLYINGIENDEADNFRKSTNNNNSPFMIGNRNFAVSAYYDGLIDEVGFWDTELSANEVTALYNSGAGLSASSNSGNYSSSGDLLIYLKMQQNLQDSANSYDFSDQNIDAPDDYDQTNF